MKRFIGVLMLAVALVGCHCDRAHAGDLGSRSVQDAGFDKLTTEQQTAVLADVAKMKNETTDFAVVSTAAKVDEWVSVGQHMGQALGGAAKELGVAVNDFAKTDVGRLTTMMVIWHYAGSELTHMLIHIVGGLLIWTIGFAFVWSMVRKVTSIHISYDTTQKNIFGNYPKKSVDQSELDSGYAGGFTVAAVVVLVTGIIVMMTA